LIVLDRKDRMEHPDEEPSARSVTLPANPVANLAPLQGFLQDQPAPPAAPSWTEAKGTVEFSGAVRLGDLGSRKSSTAKSSSAYVRPVRFTPAFVRKRISRPQLLFGL